MLALMIQQSYFIVPFKQNYNTIRYYFNNANINYIKAITRARKTLQDSI